MTTSYTACCRSTVDNEPEVCTIRFGENAGQTFNSTRRVCAVCRATSPKMVYITTRNSRKGTKTLCGAACLGGKVSCDCQCNGRCHGADHCLCGGEAD